MRVHRVWSCDILKNKAYKVTMRLFLRKLAFRCVAIVVVISLSALSLGLPPLWIVEATVLITCTVMAIYIKNWLPLIRMMPRSLSIDGQSVVIGFARETERIDLRDIAKVVPQRRFEIHMKDGSLKTLYCLSPELSRSLYKEVAEYRNAHIELGNQ